MRASIHRLFSVDPAELGPAQHRDLRLDFFRGLALFFIYLDHIPANLVNWITVRNYGFSDAAEIFIFISGYSAAIAYGGTMRKRGFVLAAARILRRCWQLYVAHIFIFVIFTAQIAYVASRFNNPMFTEEMQIVDFLNEPHVTLVQALLLKFRPANLDILPLYIVLLLFFPIILWALDRRPYWVMTASFAFYVFIQITHINLAGFPPGETWFFNPLAWQLLFITGALLGRVHGNPKPSVPRKPILLWSAIPYLVIAFLITLTWHFPRLEPYFPRQLGAIIYPISKTDLSPLRLIHFLALAYVTVTLVKANTGFISWPIFKPIVTCGQQSLYVFCAGILLSFSSHFLLIELNGGVFMQIVVSAGGIVLMIGLAYLIRWYRRMDAVGSVRQPGRTQITGGE